MFEVDFKMQIGFFFNFSSGAEQIEPQRSCEICSYKKEE